MPPRIVGSLLLAACAVLATGCSRDARRASWRPTESFAARQAIDAQWGVADKHVGQAVRDRKIIGASVAIVTTDGWSARGFGWSSASATANELTVYELGSISKVFTGTLLADMARRGEVALTQPAQTLLSGRTRMPPSTRPITLLDLSTHMSGMPRLPPGMKSGNKKDPYADFTTDDLYESLGRTRLEREPGTAKEYSNYAVGLLGQLLTTRADKPSYEELVKERILEPLGMFDTSVALRSDQVVRFAWGHDKHNQRTPPWNIVSLAGAGGLRSTARDMAVFTQAYLRPDSPIAAAAAEALVPRGVPDQGEWDQGLGWVVKRDGSYAWHNGGTGGFHTWMGIDLRFRVGVVVLCNTSIGEVDSMGGRILTEVRKHLSGRPMAALEDESETFALAATEDDLVDLEEVAAR